MQAADLFTTTEMERQWAIADVIEAYNEELNWAAKLEVLKNDFNLRDPSKIHVKNKHLRDFHAWCPVSSSYSNS